MASERPFAGKGIAGSVSTPRSPRMRALEKGTDSKMFNAGPQMTIDPQIGSPVAGTDLPGVTAQHYDESEALAAKGNVVKPTTGGLDTPFTVK
jgi:hypothetical protein